MATGTSTREQSFLLGIPVPVQPESIDRELASMWKAASPGDADSGAGAIVTRVCLSNLLWIGSAESADRARRVLTAVAQRYPSRVIIVEVDGEDPNDQLIEAFVNAQCFIVEKQQVCSEFIHFRVGAGAVRHLSGLVAPLLLADLETVMWYFSPHPSWEPALKQVMPLLDRYVTEVSTDSDPARALEGLIEAKTRAFTLGWFRMNALRERIAKLFDDAVAAKLLPAINSLVFKHDGMANNTNALTRCALTAGWMASRLGWKPLAGSSEGAFLFQGATQIVNVRVEATGRSRAGAIESLCIGFAKGETITLNLASSGVAMETQQAGARALMLPTIGGFGELEEADALGAAITTRGASKLFRASGKLAVPMLRHFVAAGGR